MIYKPKVLYNPSEERVEFRCGGESHVFEPGEKQNLDGFVAHHALTEVNTGLKEYIPGEGDVKVSNVAYDRMPWRKIVSLASERGVFKPKMTKEETIQALVEADEQETGILPDATIKETE